MRCPTCGRFVAMEKYADHVDSHEVEAAGGPTEPIDATSELVGPGAADVDDVEHLRSVVKGMPARRGRRRRRWPLVLLAMAAVGAFVGIYFALRPGGGEHLATARSKTTTTSTSVTATFSAGPPQTSAPEATTVPATTTAPGPDPRGQIKFLNGSFHCAGDGSLTVQGTVSNDGPGVYSIRFTVFILDSSGAPIDSAMGAVDHLAAGERRAYTASGTCARPVTGGARGRAQIDSITPG